MLQLPFLPQPPPPHEGISEARLDNLIENTLQFNPRKLLQRRDLEPRSGVPRSVYQSKYANFKAFHLLD